MQHTTTQPGRWSSWLWAGTLALATTAFLALTA